MFATGAVSQCSLGVRVRIDVSVSPKFHCRVAFPPKHDKLKKKLILRIPSLGRLDAGSLRGL